MACATTPHAIHGLAAGSFAVTMTLTLALSACAGGDESTDDGSLSTPTVSASSFTTSGEDTTAGPGPALGATGTDTGGGSTFEWTTGETDETTDDPSLTDATETGTGTTDVDPSTTGEPGCGGCDTPPGPCYQAFGQCVADNCVYPPLSEGTVCDDGDPCTPDDTCDGGGACMGGAPMTCKKPHANGTCEGGSCTNWKCEAPWENCDGDWGNGCEIPTGVANQCDVNGLNSGSGCWTAYCGSSNNSKATNFGSYYCMDCVNCHEPANGQWQWCSHSQGVWFPPDAGNCPAADEDKVCPAG